MGQSLCRIGVDEWLRVPSVEDVFALGDCAGFLEQTGRPVLPALAQVSFLGLLFAPHTRLCGDVASLYYKWLDIVETTLSPRASCVLQIAGC